LWPKTEFKKIYPIGYSKIPGNENEIVAFGPKEGEHKIFLSRGEGEFKGLQKSFVDKFKTALGPRAENIIAEDRDTIQEEKQRLLEAEKQLKQAAALAAQREREEKIKELQQKKERTQAQIDALQTEHGTSLEIETKTRRLNLLKKNYRTDFENAKKELAALEKQPKNKEKAQAKVDRIKARIAAKES